MTTGTCTEATLRQVIAAHGGVLAAGAHGSQYDDPACPLCVLEAHAAWSSERQRQIVTTIAWAAKTVAWAAWAADRDTVLLRAIDIWVTAAVETA